MARLPQPADIQRRTAPAQTPDITPGAIDYGPMVGRNGAAGAIAKGVGDIAKVGMAYAEQQRQQADEVDDFETRKRLMDFKLQTEMELEERRRQMPLGGAGYTSSWDETFKERARAFTGSDGKAYANIPKSQWGKVDLALKAHEMQLRERAQRDEYAERDRHTKTGLEETVGRLRNQVLLDPNKHDEVQAETARLIDLARQEGRLTPQTRDAYIKKTREEIATAALEAKANAATSAAGLAEARKAIAPHLPDRRAARTPVDANDVLGSANRFFLDKGLAPHQAAAIAGNMRWESGGKPDLVNPNDNIKNSPNSPHSIGIGQWNDRAPALIQFARSQGVEIPQGDLRDVGYARQVAKAIPLGVQLEFAWHEMQTTERAAFSRIQAAGDLRSASEGAISYHRPAGWTRNNPSAGHGFSNRFGLAEQALRSGAKPSEPDAGYMDAGIEEPTGPRQFVPHNKALALMAKAETRFKEETTDVQRLIKEQMTASEKGQLPPDDWMRVMRPRVERLQDPNTSALFATMLGKAADTQIFNNLPPLVQQRQAEADRAALGGQATKEQIERVEHRERLAANAVKQASDNLIGWGNRTRPIIPIAENADPEGIRLIRQGRGDEAIARFPGQFTRAEFDALDFSALASTSPAGAGSFRAAQEETRANLGSQLDRRIEMARRLAASNGQNVQVFAETEREVMREFFKQQVNVQPGQMDPILAVMGHVATAASRNGLDASMVLKEIAPRDAPELAMLGHMVANNADQHTLRTAATAMRWRIGQGEGFKHTVDKTQAATALNDYADVLRSAPTAIESLRSLTDMLYEYRSRGPEGKGQPLGQFNSTLYKQIADEVMGRTSDAQGNTYGGLGYQNDSYFDGIRRSPVMVPPQVKSDRFDDMLAAMRVDDIVKAGGAMPVSPDGKPYSMAQIRNMTWISVPPGPGVPPVPGVYMLKVADVRGEDGKVNPLPALTAEGRPYMIDVRPVLSDVQKRKPSIFMGYQMGLEFDQTVPDPIYPAGIEMPVRPAASAIEPRTGRDRRTTLPKNAFSEAQ